MKGFLFLLILFFAFDTLGQTRTTDIPASINGDTSVYYLSTKKIIETINLTDLKESKNANVIRIWTDKEIIEINYNDSNNIIGSHTFFATTSPEDPTKPYVFKKRRLEETQLRQINHLIDSFNIQLIPSSEKIECWGTLKGVPGKRDCNDGTTYVIEISDPKSYSYKKYDCPGAWNCKEAAIFNSFIIEIETLLETKYQFQKFINLLPKGCYSTGSFFLICNNLPRKDRKGKR